MRHVLRRLLTDIFFVRCRACVRRAVHVQTSLICPRATSCRVRCDAVAGHLRVRLCGAGTMWTAGWTEWARCTCALRAGGPRLILVAPPLVAAPPVSHPILALASKPPTRPMFQVPKAARSLPPVDSVLPVRVRRSPGLPTYLGLNSAHSLSPTPHRPFSSDLSIVSLVDLASATPALHDINISLA